MKKLFLLFTLTVLYGCTTSMQKGVVYQTKIKNIGYKNYVLGKPKSAYVGEDMISRKAYQVIVKSDLYKAHNDFVLQGGLGDTRIDLIGSVGDVYKIAGYNEHNNPVVYIPGSILMFGIDQNGKWDNTIMSSSFWTSPIGSGRAYKMTPANTTFIRDVSEKPTSENGYINHEIVFTGVGSNGISLLYREYTFKDMAREAFKQELIYPSNSKEIRFRNYVIEIKEVTPSKIIYTVKSE